MNEERQRNNERLAKLCGWEYDEYLIRLNGGYGSWVDPGNRKQVMPPDFYADSPDGAYWREQALRAMLDMRCSDIPRATEAVRKYGKEIGAVHLEMSKFAKDGETEPTYYVEFRFHRIIHALQWADSSDYIEAHNAAILAALDALEPEEKA